MVLTVMCAAMALTTEDAQWTDWLGAIFFGTGMVLSGYQLFTGRQPGERVLETIRAEIGAHAIRFQSYPYRYASVYGGGVEIPAARITCVFSSIPEVAFVLDKREIIFLERAQNVHFQAFAAAHQIPSYKITEVWMVLADAYLDQQYTESDLKRDYRRLDELGYAREEVDSLRARIRATMLNVTYYTLEWGMYTTKDVLQGFAVLNRSGFTREFYWWVMEVALRPYPFRQLARATA
jgi:hypothetical protein